MFTAELLQLFISSSELLWHDVQLSIIIIYIHWSWCWQ